MARGVGAVVYGRDHRLAVAGRGQQFDGSLGEDIAARILLRVRPKGSPG